MWIWNVGDDVVVLSGTETSPTGAKFGNIIAATDGDCTVKYQDGTEVVFAQDAWQLVDEMPDDLQEKN
jgi:preprotein translocase subunit YajC